MSSAGISARSSVDRAASPPYKPMSLLMKLVFWFVVANATLGAISLVFFPSDTESTFFWRIQPPINAGMFGALYVAAGMLVLQAVLRGRWEPARVVTVMVPFFTGLLLLTTVLHLDRFVEDARLYYWLLVYIVAPLAGIVFYVQHERGGANWEIVGQPVLPLVRAVAVALGALLALFVVVGYLAPSLVTDWWPWPISDLMVRVFLSWVSALAAGLLWFIRERDWSRLSWVATMISVAAGLMLVMLVVHGDDVESGSIGGWIFGVALLGGVLLGVAMHWLHRTPVASG